jgi:hypothetical protein
LDNPITIEEIDNVIEFMPKDKSPGPDGLIGAFMKRFWYLQPFYDLCMSFFDGNMDLQSLNTAYITLIPKINCPEVAADFRPISLVSMAMKIITKILANRL